MKRSKFTEEQVIAILREQEAGAKTADVCRRHGISSATFYAWKAKYGSFSVYRDPNPNHIHFGFKRDRPGTLIPALKGARTLNIRRAV